MQIYKFIHISKTKYLTICFILYFVFGVSILNAQNSDENKIYRSEAKLEKLFSELQNSNSDTVKEEIAKQIKLEFNNVLQIPASFEYSFELLKNVSILLSDNEIVKVYTWNIPYNNGTFKYGGFIQYKKKKSFKLTQLIDKSEEINDPEHQYLYAEKWYGALYYELIYTKVKKRDYYTLLGWDGGDLFVNRKIIEVFTINNKGIPRFGGTLQAKNRQLRRKVFEYSNKANMVLRYDKNVKMIVFDHLSPSKPKYQGQTQYYGPDFSHDGLFFEKGKWIYSPDIDVRNPKEKANKRKIIKSY